ncbi:MAG: hypothetical protein QOK45_435 [Mycobacterium sp.]|nr:hypothetical protein [Mycobacterium sp.]
MLADWLVGYIYLAVCAVLGFRAGLVGLGLDVRDTGCLRFDVGGLRFDLGCGLPAQPDRPGSGTRGGGSRLRLGRLSLRFLREGKCVCRVGRPIRILLRLIDVVIVDQRRAAPERRHSDLPVC